jgi:uncharacterized cupredoxin-like copper-binding protein
MMTYEVVIIIIVQAQLFNGTERGKIMYKMKRIFGGVAIVVFLAAFILAACGGSPASNTPVEVQMTVNEFSITSSLTTFKVGVNYHFVVVNKGTMPHELIIMAPTTPDMTADQIQAAKAAGLDAITGDNLTPGSTQSMTYQFLKAYPAGTLEFACHLPGHYESGMKLPIVVQ